MYRPSVDSFGEANNCNPATVDYFIKVFGYQEALELSNIDDPTSNRVDDEKIQIALNDAAVLINNYIETAPPQGKLLIAGSYRRTQSVIARWYLDSLRPRAQVIEAAEKALQQLELWANKLQPTAVFRFQEAYRYWNSSCGMVRASTNRRRQFTQNSMHAWETLYGSNNEWNTIARKEANISSDVVKGRVGDIGQNINVSVPDALVDLNNLVDALEATRSLSSFENTGELADGAVNNGDLLTGTNDGTLDNLQPGDNY